MNVEGSLRSPYFDPQTQREISDHALQALEADSATSLDSSDAATLHPVDPTMITSEKSTLCAHHNLQVLSKKTPLYLATVQGNPEEVVLLLEQGADPTILGIEGDSSIGNSNGIGVLPPGGKAPIPFEFLRFRWF